MSPEELKALGQKLDEALALMPPLTAYTRDAHGEQFRVLWRQVSNCHLKALKLAEQEAKRQAAR